MRRIAEYIWIDGTEPTPSLRSKTKVLRIGQEPPVWGFDGSSTNQAEGDNSDCVLMPVYWCKDPLRRGDNILVMCQVMDADMYPHATNNRFNCATVHNNYADQQPWYGLEQEYTLFKDGRPLGFPQKGLPNPQGQYYCSVGSDNSFGREIAEEHLYACIAAGIEISGINGEVCPGQWEFQIGPLDTVAVSDQLWVARWLLQRIAEQYGVVVDYSPKPVTGDWNGAGCHTNFSTRSMRNNMEAITAACEKLGKNPEEHIAVYGHNIEQRLTGDHETCSYKEFKYGVSDRGASIRIPWQVQQDGRGYIEDRRPNANCDPYLVTAAILKTVCEE